MTILSAQTIKRLCMDYYLVKDPDSIGGWDKAYQSPMIEPFVERGVDEHSGKSYGLSSAGYDIRVSKFLPHWGGGDLDSIRMEFGDFVLASSMERFKLPTNVIGRVCDKSSWAREGLAVQNTVLEPGWEGYLTLELSFQKRHSVANIRAGMPIAQILFEFLDEPTIQPYTGKYQNQPDRPVESIKERNNA